MCSSVLTYFTSACQRKPSLSLLRANEHVCRQRRVVAQFLKHFRNVRRGKKRRDAADEAKSTSDAPRVPSGPVRSLALGDSVTSAAPRCFPTGLLVKGGNVKGAERCSFPLLGSHGDPVRGRSRAQRDVPLLFPVFYFFPSFNPWGCRTKNVAVLVYLSSVVIPLKFEVSF